MAQMKSARITLLPAMSMSSYGSRPLGMECTWAFWSIWWCDLRLIYPPLACVPIYIYIGSQYRAVHKVTSVLGRTNASQGLLIDSSNPMPGRTSLKHTQTHCTPNAWRVGDSLHCFGCHPQFWQTILTDRLACFRWQRTGRTYHSSGCRPDSVL